MSRARSLANLANSGVFSADASTSRVGINSTAPTRTLDVDGDGRVSGSLSIGGTINYEDVTSIDSVGVVTAREGVHIVSAGASIYSPVNNQLALYTNGNERVRVDSSGSVGIGTDNPGGSTLAVVESPLASFSVGQNVDGTGQNHLGMYYGNIGAANTAANIFTSNGDMNFWVDGAAAPGSSIQFGRAFGADTWMTMLSSGSIGIGITQPQNQLSLGTQAGGLIGLSLDWTGAGGPYPVASFSANRTNGEIRIGGVRTNFFPTFYANDVEGMRLTTERRLLVNTTVQNGTANQVAISSEGKNTLSLIDTTSYATGVGGAINLGGNYRTTGDAQAFVRISAVKENSVNANYSYGMQFDTTSNGGSNFGVSAMRLDSSGRVILNHTDPILRFSRPTPINAADSTLGLIEFYNNDPSGDGPTVSASIQAFTESSLGAGGYLTFSTETESNSTLNTERMRLDAAGVLRINETGDISGSATPRLFVRTASSTDTSDIVAKFGNNNTTTSSEALIAMSAGYSLTANDTEGHVYFGAQRGGNGNRSGFIVKTWDGANFNRHFRVDSLGGTNIMRSQNGGTHDNSNSLDNWWRVGEFRNVTQGWRGHITLMGAQSYSAGSNTSGHTRINLCIVNNNTITGHFYGVSGGTGTVKGVATAYDSATDILQVWVQPVTSYAGFGVLANGSYGGWYADNTNTGSNAQPAGTTALSSHVKFQVYGADAFTIESDKNVRLSRAGLTIFVRNSATAALINSANLPVTLVSCTTDGGTNTALVYWGQNYGANQNQGCLGAVTSTDNIVAPGTSVNSGCTIFGFVGRL